MSRIGEHIKTLLKLDAFAIGIMHFSNQFINSIASGKNMLKPGGGKYFRWKHGEVFYHVYGEGDPIVLLHHLHPAFSSYEWNEVIDRLAADHTVYTLDLPGCGRSSKKNMSYTNYFYVLFLTSFIKEVVKKPCTVIASGYSSSFAIMAASADDRLMSRIIAVNPKSINELKSSSTKKRKAASVLLSLPIVGTSVYNISVSRENIDFSFTEKYLNNPFRSKARFVDAFYESAHFNEGNGKHLLASIQSRMLAVDISKALQRIGDKLIILSGQRSENYESILSQYEKQNPAVRSVSIPDTKYVPHMERPSEFIDACSNFLS